ncbi:MAG: GAF domain-containing protein, partial [Endomicrobiia bacterium]
MGEILQKTQLKSDILLRKFTKVIPHISDLDKFLKLVIDLIANIFKIENISMVLLDEETGKCLVRVSTVSREENSNVQFRTKESSITWLTDHTKFLYKGEFRSIQQIGITPSLVKEMNLIGLNMCIPLTVDNRIIGFLGLGEKINNESFTSDDLRLLSMLTDYLAVIIDHAFFHKAVFNQKEHHRNILDNITCGTITVDTEGKVTTFNRSAEAILGFKAHHVIGKDVQMIQGNLANLILDTLR